MTESDLLSVHVLQRDDSIVVVIDGEIDIASAPEIQAVLDRLGSDCDVIVDVAGVDFMDSSGLKMFLADQMSRSLAGGSLHIRNSPRHVRRLMDVTGLGPLLLEPNSI
jgi:anti-sigma B factor antagonist